MIDAHLHLQDISEPIYRDVLHTFDQLNVSAVFCNASSPGDWGTVLDFAKDARVFPFIGTHPWYVDQLISGWEEQWIACLKRHACGIGEIGLDQGPKGKDIEKQMCVLVRQIDAAVMLRRPFVLHCVNAWGPMMQLLRACSLNGLPFVVHSFCGSIEILDELIRMGALISIGQRSLRQRQADGVLQRIPDNRLLLETDFPYLPGKNKDDVGVGDYQESIARVYQQASVMRGMSVEALIHQTVLNAAVIIKYIQNDSL